MIIGRGLGLLNEWPLAAEAFRQAVNADGENAEAWAWLGEAEQQLGRDGRAELDNALSLGRTNPIVRSLRGLYWMRQGRADQALAEYLLAAEYDPGNPAWQISIGEAYVQRGDLQSAQASVFACNRNCSYRCDVLAFVGEFQRAIQYADRGCRFACRADGRRIERGRPAGIGYARLDAGAVGTV